MCGDYMFSVIFDMDGTLLDTQRICIPAWEYAGRLQDIKGMGSCIEKVCGMNEIGWTAYIESNYPTLNTAEFKENYRDYIKKNGEVRFMPGAEPLMKFLKDKGVKVALASGTRRATLLGHLKKLSCEDYFDAIVGGDEIENGKPAPDIFLKAAELLCEKPENCFVFEDSANGVRAAVSAGMKCIGIPDVAPLSEEVKSMLFAELNNLGEAMEVLNKII